MQPIIELDDVSFSYGTGASRALDGIALTIEEGSFVGVIGPSGAGKTTLAHCLSGAIPHHFGGELYGAVRVAGQDTCDISLTDTARIVGSVLQDIDAQMVAAVVEDELLFGLENFGVAHDQIEQRLTAALEAVGIADLRDREIATLSGGQKQKVAIAAILALRPRVLVLDEPTAALDPVSARSVFETLDTLNRQEGITVVVIEQSVGLLSRFCDRIIVMDRGRVAIDGTPRAVFAHADELRALGVDSPRVARISNSLAARGLCPAGSPCLDVAETADLIERVLADHGAAPTQAAAGTVAAHGAAPTNEDERADAASPVVEFNRASFAYPTGGAGVCDLTLSVYPGEICSLIGENGAGKTTATKLVNGLIKPQAGSVTIAGLDTRRTPVSTLAAHVATLFQNPDHQLCRPTVLDEVAFGPELQGMDPDAARERAAKVVTRFGLDGARDPFSLSRGQRQMVALASVVVMDTEVVLLDEPTSGLDYRECMTVMEAVAELARQGRAVIMVCHDMEVVSDFADRVAVMAAGRIVACDRTHRIFADEDLVARAGVTPPQVMALARALERRGYAAFAGATEVSDIVSRTRELI